MLSAQQSTIGVQAQDVHKGALDGSDLVPVRYIVLGMGEGQGSVGLKAYNNILGTSDVYDIFPVFGILLLPAVGGTTAGNHHGTVSFQT